MRVPISLIGLGLALGVALTARSVQAQTDDHLKCYQTTGPGLYNPLWHR